MDGLRDVIESEILPTISKAAPLLGSLLGTPFAGVVISLIASAFGVNPKDLGALADKLSSPDAQIKLKELEMTHAETLTQIAASSYATEVDDRKDARKNAVLYKDFLRHMAYLVTLGFFMALALLFMPVTTYDPNERELLSMLIGMLVSKWQTIIDFFYGSSRNKQGGLTNE